MKTQCNLILHCGAHRVERQALHQTSLPQGSRTWTPIPHVFLLELVERTLLNNGITVHNQAHSLTHDGSRYFGLLEVGKPQENHSWVVGLRNSHDKSFPAGIVAGMIVCVCDNLSFNGEVRLTRKHTRHILRDIPGVTQSAIGKLMELWHAQEQRIRHYTQYDMTDTMAHDIIVRSIDNGVLSNRALPSVLKEWREPRHSAFEDRTMWSLFNAFTETLKGNLIELPKRTQRLHGLLDNYCGIAPVLHGLN
ncbi:MAG: DUF932 domain-containing protein [Chthoniobacterales bacterium]